VATALSAAPEFRPHLTLVDYSMPDGTAFDVLQGLKTAELECATIVLTGHGTIDLAVQAMKLGAENFLTKPVDLESVLVLVKRALDAQRRDRSAVAATVGSRRKDAALDPFVGTSEAIAGVRHLAEGVVESEAPVLILGETGTGKGVLSRWLHDHGPRHGEPFVDLNCSGLSRELAESELFGHQKGSFTNASASKQGLIEVAHNGTLFLDEIGDLDPTVQPKLLKVLEEKTYRKVGEVRSRHVDIRLVAATHRNLGAMTQEGSFRTDLLFRINTITFELPPLRERLSDLPALSERILAGIGSGQLSLEPAALEVLSGYHWPGNTRELRNVLERATLFCRGSTIDASALQFSKLRSPRSAPPREPMTLLAMERQHILEALQGARGHVERAAEQLGMPRSSLYARLKKLGIDPSRV
jgi:DNA-binding NtrC family response regulator